MNTRTDSKSNAVYVRLQSEKWRKWELQDRAGSIVDHTEPLETQNDMVNLDYDEDKNLIGVEVIELDEEVK